MDKFLEAYEKLNSEQRMAVDTIEGPVMVIAGPGTGKTQTLSLRIANILRKTQLDPQNILCLTFTENGSVAVLNRLIEFIGPSAYKVKIFTFHSFCKSIILNNFERFPQVTEGAENIDDTDKFVIIQTIVKSLPLSDPLKNVSVEDLYVEGIISAISDLKKEGISPDKLELIIKREADFFKEIKVALSDFLSLRSTQIKEKEVEVLVDVLQKHDDGQNIYLRGVHEIIGEIGMGKSSAFKQRIKNLFKDISSPSYFEKLSSLQTVYKRYQAELRKRGTYDYDDMIMFVLEKLNNDESFLNEIQEQYQYILIDEYQDTNSAQNELIELIGSYFPNPNIFVVGDDDQSIFRFQGASLENVLYFHKRYPEQKTLALKTNYRSQPIILKASREVILQSENRLEDEIHGVDKNLLANRDKPQELIKLIEANDLQGEAYAIGREVKYLLKNTEPKDIAVIVTTNSQMDLYEEVFNKLAIEYQVSKSGNALDSSHVRNILLLIEYLNSPNDKLLGQLLFFSYWVLDVLEIAKVIRYCSNTRTSISTAISTPAILKDAGIENVNLFVDFARALFSWEALIKAENPIVFFTTLLQESNILKAILSCEDNYQQLTKVNKIFDFLKKQVSNNKDFTFAEFLNKVHLVKKYRLNVFNETPLGSESCVNILTVHKSKGLEYRYVFIPNLTERNWEKKRRSRLIKLPPSINKQDISSNDLDEKIRLFYVALTRTQDRLYLSYPRYDDNGKESKKSMFISLINEDYMEKSEIRLDKSEHMEQLSLQLQSRNLENFSHKGKKFLYRLLANYMLSPTDLISYRSCPHCFFLNKLIRLPQMMSPQQAYGSAIHMSLQDFLNKYKRVREFPKIEHLVESFKISLTRQVLLEKDFEDFLLHGESNLRSFYDTKLKDLDLDSIPELNFKKYNIRINDIPITGKIDRIDFVDSSAGLIRVIDYKTGKYKPTKVSVKGKGDYYIQLLFYKILIDNFPKYNWIVNEGKVVYVEPNAGKIQDDKLISLEDADIKWLEDEIKVTYNAIMNLEFNRKNLKNCFTPELHDINFLF